DILTNRNQLSDDILQDVAEVAADYGVAIHRAHVKDIVFPGNLQEIMNRVLATERLSEAQRVEAHTKADTARIEAEAKAAVLAEGARAQADASRVASQASSSRAPRRCLGWTSAAGERSCSGPSQRGRGRVPATPTAPSIRSAASCVSRQAATLRS